MINAINSNLVVNTVKSLASNAVDGASTTQTSGASFEQILAQISDAVGSNLSHAEQASMKNMAGKTVGMTEVINSVMAAERSLNTAIALRDKMVQAYNEITKMQI